MTWACWRRCIHRRRAVVFTAAIAEMNQLSGFTVSYEPIKRRRSVAAITLSWAPKRGHERAATKREVVRRFKAAFGVEGERGVSLLSDEA